ncbi:hypothetical protein N9355_07375 [Crocinitomicaceae bacterium]|nr:hypothetical protein [Crocinitomicaceae bacterium]
MSLLIDAGIKFLNKEEKKHMEDGKITREGAEKTATATKKNHNVFSAFQVVDGKDTWDYKYKARSESV